MAGATCIFPPAVPASVANAPANCLPHCLPRRVFSIQTGRENFKKPLRRKHKCNLPPNVVRSTPKSGHSSVVLGAYE